MIERGMRSVPSARAGYRGGLGTQPPAGSRGVAPAGVRGASPPENFAKTEVF